MKNRQIFMLTGLLAMSVAPVVHALDQSTKDSINEAGAPVQRGASEAVNGVQDAAHDTAKATKKEAKRAKQGAKKAGRKTQRAASNAENKTEDAVHDAAH